MNLDSASSASSGPPQPPNQRKERGAIAAQVRVSTGISGSLVLDADVVVCWIFARSWTDCCFEGL